MFCCLIWILVFAGLYIQIPSKTGGSPEKKHVLLDDHDPVWLEFRHAHIGVVSPVLIHIF